MQTTDKNISYSSPGKLLLTGEYLVLLGAEALALPVRFGQSLRIRKKEGIPALLWKTVVDKKPWFEATYSLPELVIANTNDFPTAQAIRTLLLNARELNPGFLDKAERIEAIAELDYDIKWGLGSSSSLTVNIARWAKIDHFNLHFRSYEGSGYDVAASYEGKPIIYMLKKNYPYYSDIEFNPPFRDNIWFVYLGKKKNTAQAIANFEKTRKIDLTHEMAKISTLTRLIARSTDVLQFSEYLRAHDRIISDVINTSPLSETLFRSFNGYAKYLGAWGGDFAMLVSSYPREYIMAYLRKKDIKIAFPYENIIKKASMYSNHEYI